MKFRKTKSLILLCLIISSVFLSFYVWLGEELWPTGYNFFIMLRNNSVISALFPQKEVYSMPKENLSKPQRIVITNGAERTMYYNSDDSFDSLHDIVRGALTHALANKEAIKNQTVAEASEWYNILRNDEVFDSRSIFIEYSLAYTPNLFAHVTGIQNTWIEEEVSSLKQFIIVPTGSQKNEFLLYVKDFEQETVHKYLVEGGQQTSVYNAADDYTKTSETAFNYAFELNFSVDRQGTGIGEGVSQKVFLDPMIMFSYDKTQTSVIQSSNPLADDAFVKDRMLSVFHYNYGAPRHYTDPLGIEYYVENYSLLKIHPNGLVEYTADRVDMGIALSDKPASLYESLNSAIEFAERFWQSVMPDMPFNVLVTSDLLEDDSDVYRFTLDYYYDGNPVTVELMGAGFEPMNHAIEIYVSGGRIIKYRHFISKYETVEETTNLSILEALDLVYESISQTLEGEEEPAGNILVADIFLSYVERGVPSAKTSLWCARIADRESLIYTQKGGD